MPANGPQLRDIHMPPEPSWWPPAPGWWLLMLLSVALLLWGAWFLRRRLRRQQRDRRILAELEKANLDWSTHRDDARFLADLSAFLRRLGRMVDAGSATLGANAWLEFLDRHGDDFGSTFGDALLQAPYRKNPKVDTDALWKTVQGHTRIVLAKELNHV